MPTDVPDLSSIKSPIDQEQSMLEKASKKYQDAIVNIQCLHDLFKASSASPTIYCSEKEQDFAQIELKEYEDFIHVGCSHSYHVNTHQSAKKNCSK